MTLIEIYFILCLWLFSLSGPRPLSRYITVSSQTNTETLVVFRLASLFSAYNDTVLPCTDCDIRQVLSYSGSAFIDRSNCTPDVLFVCLSIGSTF